MSISFAGIPAQTYIGAPYSIPVQIAGKAGRAVPLQFNWISYGAFTSATVLVQINLGAGRSGQAAPMLDQIRSLYIDNTGSALPVYVQFDDTQFTVAAQPYSVGWYPIFSNAFSFKVACNGFTPNNIGAALIYVTNVVVSAFTDAALQAVLSQGLSSPVIGGGSSLNSIAVQIPGQSYNNGSLAISGGGGTGATASGTLDQWGRFTSVTINSPGGEFTGIPTITPTGGQYAVPALTFPGPTLTVGEHFEYGGTEWAWEGAGTIPTGALPWVEANYAAGLYVTYGSNIYLSRGAPFTVPPAGNVNSTAFWQWLGTNLPVLGSGGGGYINSGSAPDTPAAFLTTLTAQSQPITTSGFGPEALGDQSQSVLDVIAGAGIVRANLWGTPFASGFIYLTHLHVNQLSVNGGGTLWQIEDDAGLVMFPMFSPGSVCNILSLQKMNAKLDATKNWRIRCTSFAGSSGFETLSAFAWTYSQN